MLLLGALLGGRLLRGRPVRGPVRLGRVAYSTRLRTSWRPASWRRASWRRVFAWRRPWLMCLRYLARGRERWRSIRGPRRLRTTRRPGALARAHAPGTVPRASLPPHRARHGPLVRRRSAAAIGPTTQRRVAVDAPQKAAPPARASRMSVGVAAHVFSGNCGVVRRSEPRNPRADCVLGHGVATALRHGFVPRFRVAPLAATALRL